MPPLLANEDAGRLRKHAAAALLLGLALRLFFVWRFPFEAGDTRIYEEIARNWLDRGIYGLLLDGQVTPVSFRAPGYPAFLAAVYALFGRGPKQILVTQAMVDLGACLLTAALAARLASNGTRIRVAIAALWLSALCPFTANYAAALLTETPAVFLSALALLLLVRAFGASASAENPQGAVALRGFRQWFPAGFVVGVGTLVRPEAPLLLIAAGLVLAFRWRRASDWAKLLVAAAWMAAGLITPLLPWAARNWHTFHRVQFLVPRYAEVPGEYPPSGFYYWTRTWLVRLNDAYDTVWKLEEEPLKMESFPAGAFDSAQERERVASLLVQYNASVQVTPAWDSEFERLAGERTARRPLRTYVWVPLRRAWNMWFTPRIEALPYSGGFWPLAQKWEEDRTDLLVTAGFPLLNFCYAGLAIAGLRRARASPGIALLVVFIVVRTAFMTRAEVPEPRYTLECFPALLALAALVWNRTVERST